MKLLATDGLLFHEDGEIVDCGAADAIAFANKIWYAENLVKQYDGKIICISPNNKIEETIENKRTIMEWKQRIEARRKKR